MLTASARLKASLRHVLADAAAAGTARIIRVAANLSHAENRYGTSFRLHGYGWFLFGGCGSKIA